jgi:hypothetical protein
MAKVSTTNDFIKRAREIHGDKYDYSKVEYINSKTKVCIICTEHGEFWQTPSNHLQGHGCTKCKIEKSSIENKSNIRIFTQKSCVIHNNKYDYSKVEYIDSKTKVCIICTEHGEFWQTPSDHLKGRGCPKCKNVKSSILHTKTNEQFLKEIRQIHNNKYDYSKVKYANSHKKICIICPVHGEFWQTPNSHLNGQGCPKCGQSHMEKEIMQMLENNKIKYVYNQSLQFLGKQRLDFYIPSFNIAIECQGKQHFCPSNFGSKQQTEQDCFLKVIERDTRKLKLCKENDVKLFYYTNLSGYDTFLGEKVYTDINELFSKCFLLN